MNTKLLEMELPDPFSIEKLSRGDRMQMLSRMRYPGMPPKKTYPQKSLEIDFAALSQRQRSTSTPFGTRTISTSSALFTPTITEASLEDSAIGTSVTLEDTSDESPNVIPLLPKLSLFQDGVGSHDTEEGFLGTDVKPLALSFAAISDQCLSSPTSTVLDAPCLHCSREKYHSDSQLSSPDGSSKFSASGSHLAHCRQCLFNQKSKCDSGKKNKAVIRRRSSPNYFHSQSNHDTGYNSSAFDQSTLSSSVEHLSNTTNSSMLPYQEHSQPPCSLASDQNSLAIKQRLTSSHTTEQTSLKSSPILPSTAMVHPDSVTNSISKKASDHITQFHIISTLQDQKCAPRQLDRLIGRRVGSTEAVDIVGTLQQSGFTLPLKLVLQYISDKELSIMCRISSQWRAAVVGDDLASKRLTKRKQQHRLVLDLEKENCGKKSSHSQRGITLAQRPLSVVQHVGTPSTPLDLSPPGVSPEIHNVLQLTHKYWKEAQQLKNEETLRKCPQCSSPARTEPLQDRAKCTKTDCKFDFCIRCRSPFHGSINCGVATTPKKQRPELKVCGRKSKKNLRRL